MNQYFSLLKHERNPYQMLINGLFYCLFLSNCASVKKIALEKDINQIINQSDVFSSQFTGFSLYDMEANEFIASYNSTLKFTPASNTKLLTMYATLKSFEDSIPSLHYLKTDSSLIIAPLGDPTFLNHSFPNQKAFELLNNAPDIKIIWPNEQIAPYGSGWAWDDYIYSYQQQRAWWPIYGNLLSIKKVNDSLFVTPQFFEDYVEVLKQEKPGELVNRELKFNVFKAYIESDTTNFERFIPFEYSKELLMKLLDDTLSAPVSLLNMKVPLTDTLYSHHVDTVLSKMMKPSDNFLAEQLLLMSANANGFIEINDFIKHIKATWLVNLNDIVWVDGSGLSRYNLISPVDQVRLLKMCHDEFGWERITSILPTGGEGTLSELYLIDDEEIPYIFAKTGTLSNNHNLSGYLITKSGKRLIFSLMNNHYTKPTSEIKAEMQRFLLEIRNAY
ncbi:D-alanyl-D-alanine carboxypeptidase [Ekhidna sp.]|uniref:D-alanyl-D-alanine carboxypeptidase n=1 Tax=Ekhidna sp. TaxID=2608089 RepID=UPI003B507C40